MRTRKHEMRAIRSLQTSDDKLKYRQVDKQHKAFKRANETDHERTMRRKADSTRKASERANESDAKRSMRRKADSLQKSNKRRRLLSPKEAIADFKAKIMYSADYVSTCCHRLLFREAVA